MIVAVWTLLALLAVAVAALVLSFRTDTFTPAPPVDAGEFMRRDPDMICQNIPCPAPGAYQRRGDYALWVQDGKLYWMRTATYSTRKEGRKS